MPAPRAILIDLEEKGLNPNKHHSNCSNDGHLKSSDLDVADVVEKVENKEKMPQPPVKVEVKKVKEVKKDVVDKSTTSTIVKKTNRKQKSSSEKIS